MMVTDDIDNPPCEGDDDPVACDCDCAKRVAVLEVQVQLLHTYLGAELSDVWRRHLKAGMAGAAMGMTL